MMGGPLQSIECCGPLTQEGRIALAPTQHGSSSCVLLSTMRPWCKREPWALSKSWPIPDLSSLGI